MSAIWGDGPPLRWIPLAAGDGAWNMSVDEALLETATETGQPTLRFYTWSRPTLSLGYFQTLEQRQSHPASLSCDLVRRASGGGAIVHHHELTYSLAAPRSRHGKELANSYYLAVHEAIVAVLAEIGVKASLFRRADSREPRSDPFLCFLRRAANDIVVGEFKICGSAQRRTHSAVLQHGSILIRKSEFAPELLGIEELSTRILSSVALCDRLALTVFERFSTAWVHGELRTDEIARANEIHWSKYSFPGWCASTRKSRGKDDLGAFESR